MSNKVCQICGQEKPAEAFSKSYPKRKRKRCRDCVLEQARKRRKLKPKLNGHAPVIITDDPVFNPLPDFLQEGKPQEPDWEQRRYDLALAIFHKLSASDFHNPGIAARRAKEAATTFINLMRDQDT